MIQDYKGVHMGRNSPAGRLKVSAAIRFIYFKYKFHLE